MITVNLLPESHRRPKESSVLLFLRSPLFFTVAVVMIGAVGLLVLVSNMRRTLLAQVKSQVQQMDGARAEMLQLAQSVQKLREQRLVLEQMVKSRSRWARHLNRLSDATPEGIWFTDMLLDHDKGLVIQGSAIGKGGEEMVHIGRLAKDLTDDKDFSSIVRDVRIQSIESVQEKEVEVIRFTLTGTLGQNSGANQP